MKKTVFFLFALMAMVSCSSDDPNEEIIDNEIPEEEEIFMSFKVNGETYEMEPFTASSMSTLVRGEEGLDENYTALSLWMPNDFTVGTHEITDASPSEVEAYTASFEGDGISVDATSGVLEITSISEDYFEGTFNFTGVDSDGNEVNVTEGTFRTDNLQ